MEERRMLAASNWGLDAIEAPHVWSQGYAGQGVTVAVIDTGIDPHVDLLPNLWRNPGELSNAIDDDGNGYVNDFNGWDFAENDNNPLTKNGHGNHVLGVVAAARNELGSTGVAYRAKIMPLRVFDDDGNSSTRRVANAVRFAVDNGAQVINLSVGGIASNDVDLAIRHALNHDVLIVASSGNSAESVPSFPASASKQYANVISVGAHDSNFRRWTATNRVGNSGAVQLDAPGVGILSTWIDQAYSSSSGTSSAAAHVAGVAALVLSARPGMDVEDLRGALVAGATRKVGGSDSRGAVNARRAVEAALADASSEHFADFDHNGRVDFSDFLRLSSNFGESGKTHADGDTDRNGTVDFSDFLAFSRVFGRETGAALDPDAVDTAFDDSQPDGVVRGGGSGDGVIRVL